MNTLVIYLNCSKMFFETHFFPVVRIENNCAHTCLEHYKNNNYVIVFKFMFILSILKLILNDKYCLDYSH